MDDLQTMYRTSSKMVRLSFDGDVEKAAQYYELYVDFVMRAAPLENGNTLLDIGCGSGWSSYEFARHGYGTTGADLNPASFEPPPTENLTLRQGSALDLPFGDASFDVVTAFQTLEHIPDPRRALLEMLRVCKPGGTICIVGPNLLGLGMSARSVLTAFKNRPARRIFRREAGMSRHPFGNTVGESLGVVILNSSRVVRKSLARRASFSMRRPDMVPPFYSDNDACYLCNPIDLTKFFQRHGCRITRNGALHRLPHTSVFQTGTWIAARKDKS